MSYCPICKKYMLQIDHSGIMCPQRVHFSNGYQRSHVELTKEGYTWCAPPYLIINNTEKNHCTVMITKSYESERKRAEPVWDKFFEADELIQPGDDEKLKKRLKLLLLFS